MSSPLNQHAGDYSSQSDTFKIRHQVCFPKKRQRARLFCLILAGSFDVIAIVNTTAVVMLARVIFLAPAL